MVDVAGIAGIQRAIGTELVNAIKAARLSSKVETAPLIYHSSEPDDCCPEPGGPPRIVVWWKNMAMTDARCGGPLLVDMTARLLVCWPAPDARVVGQRIEEVYGWTTHFLGNVAWLGATVLASYECDKTRAPLTLGASKLVFKGTTPRAPRGGCAGVDWNFSVVPHASGADFLTMPAAG